MKEYLLSTNEFLEPKIVDGSDAYGILLLRLFLLEPGMSPTHPKMGIGISKKRYITEDKIPDLRMEIQDQINTYLPTTFSTVTNVTIDINKNKYLIINVSSNDTKYVYDTEQSDTPIQLSDILA